MQTAGDHLLVVLHRLHDRSDRDVGDGRQRSEAGDEIGERLAIAFGECSARHRQIGDDEHAVGDGFAVAIAAIFGHRFDRMTGRMTKVQNAAET